MMRLHHAGRAMCIAITIISSRRPLGDAQRGERWQLVRRAVGNGRDCQRPAEADALLEEHAAAGDVVAANLSNVASECAHSGAA